MKPLKLPWILPLLRYKQTATDSHLPKVQLLKSKTVEVLFVYYYTGQ